MATLLAMTGLVAGVLFVLGWVFNGKLQVALNAANRANETAQLNADEANKQRDKVENQNEEITKQRDEEKRLNEELTKQRDEAKKQRDEVAAGFAKRLATVNEMVEKINGRLAKAEGMESIRLEFMHDLMTMSDALLKERPDDPVARRQLARAWVSLGGLHKDMGFFPDGAADYQNALNLMAKLADETKTYEDRSQVALHPRPARRFALRRRHLPRGPQGLPASHRPGGPAYPGLSRQGGRRALAGGLCPLPDRQFPGNDAAVGQRGQDVP